MTAKEFLTQHKIEFEYKDISQDKEALKDLTEKYKSRGTPTIVIDDTVLVGFQKEKIEQALGLT